MYVFIYTYLFFIQQLNYMTIYPLTYLLTSLLTYLFTCLPISLSFDLFIIYQ